METQMETATWAKASCFWLQNAPSLSTTRACVEKNATRELSNVGTEMESDNQG